MGLAFDDDLEEAVLLAMSQDENLGGSEQGNPLNYVYRSLDIHANTIIVVCSEGDT